MEEERRSCYNCANMKSMYSDVIDYLWCEEDNRDFTFGDTSHQACDEWREENKIVTQNQ